jgi:hypothetical protein
MTTTIKIYAPRDLTSAVQWNGSNLVYQLIKGWGADVKRSKNDLLLQEPSRTVVVPPGDYIALLSGKFFHFDQEEFENRFVEVK